MSRRNTRLALFMGLAITGSLAILTAAGAQAQRPLALDTTTVTISGTSNIHAYTASTTAVRVTRAALAGGVAGPEFWAAVVKPGAVQAFEVAIPAAQLSSPKEGLDKNMHKALKAAEHAEITFRLTSLEPGAAAGALKANGVLRIAGAERNVTLDLATERRGANLAVKGTLDLLMTDFGIKPPTAMLGMLKTDPKVTVTFETVLSVPLT